MRKCARFFLCRVCNARATNEETPPNVVCVHIISRLIFFIFLPKHKNNEGGEGRWDVHSLLLFQLLRVAAERAERAQPTDGVSDENFQKKERNTLLASSSSLCGISDEESNERKRERYAVTAAEEEEEVGWDFE